MGVTWRAPFFGLLLVSLLVKLWLAWHLPLFVDESFYWLESDYLAFAYDDVPGLVPWLIALATGVGGDASLVLRLPFLALGLLTLWLLMRMTAALGESTDRWLAGTLLLLLPLFVVNGLLALPDVPLSLAIVLCAEALRRLVIDARGGAALLAFGLALGWFSHYRFAVPMAAVGLCLLIHPVGRQLLMRPRVWLAGLFGVGIGLAPLLWHQFGQGGAGFAFQFVDRHPWQFAASGFADLPLQALVATPLLFVLLLGALVWSQRSERSAERRLLAWASLSMLLCYLLLAPFVDDERSRLHWPLPSLLLACALAPSALAAFGRRMRWLLQAAVALAAICLGGVLVFLLTLAHAPARLAESDLYLEGFTAWPRVAEIVADHLAQLPADTVLVADHAALAAQLSFAASARPKVYSLDHALNRKHGRQGVLASMRLDALALQTTAHGRPILLVIEASATRFRERPDWFRELCLQFPGARPLFDLALDHGRKRLIGYLQPAHGGAGCVPPALGYVDAPLAGQRVGPEFEVRGWAIRDGSGIKAIRARLAGQDLGELRADLAVPGVLAVFPRSTDPRHPRVGFAGRLRSTLPIGRYWLEIEAEGVDGARAIIVSVPVQLQTES